MADFREIQGKASRAGIVLGLVLILFIIGISKMSIVINAGEAGVLFKTLGGGVETEKTYGEGFHIIAPWNKMIRYEVRQNELLEQVN